LPDQDTGRGALTAEETLQNVFFIDITLASWPALLEIADGAEKALVWLDEGRFNLFGTFEFNSSHGGIKPMVVDQASAVLMKTLHDALNETNQSKLKELVIKSRWHFVNYRELSEQIT
jgi:hypothetical protein